MNLVSLVDPGDEQTLAEMKTIMKTFGSEISKTKSTIKEIFDVQNIMEEGKVNDLAQCIHSILNYSFDNNCVNNAVKIIDASFVKCIHIAQLVIRFLLYFKSYICKDNTRLKIQLQEHDKLRRECYVRKLEARELKKQLLRYQHSDSDDIDSSDVSENIQCLQCRKVFVNSIFLYAHHKRRHSDQPFLNSRSSAEIRSLKDEINSLKSQMRKLSKHSEQNYKIDVASQKVIISPIKMKVTNESSCLEAQEKYWRGKMKEMQDKLDDEMRQMKHLLENLTIENDNLKKELSSQSNFSTCSVAIQTEISLAFDLFSLRANIENDFPSSTSKPVISNFPSHLNLSRHAESISNEFSPSKPIIFDSNVASSHCTPSDSVFHANEYENLRYFQNSLFSTDSSTDTHEYDVLPPKKPDIIDEVDTFLENYEKLKAKMDARSKARNERCNNIETVIAKLFAETNETYDPLTEKLINVYNRRSIRDQSTSTDLKDILYDTKGRQQSSTDARESSSTDFERNANSIESIDTRLEMVKVVKDEPTFPPVKSSRTSHRKSKLQLMPLIRDIRSTIMKKYSKSRKTCSDIIENEITSKVSTAHPDHSIIEVSNETQNSIVNGPVILTTQTRPSEEKYSLSRLAFLTPDKKRPLTSALKKSKSTGNIAKRVAFSDDLPTLRAASETDLRKLPESTTMRVSTKYVDSLAVRIAPMDCNLRIKPVPAPRSKKNVNTSENQYSSSEFEQNMAEIEKNME